MMVLVCVHRPGNGATGDMTWDEATSFPSQAPASCVYFDPMTRCECPVVWRWEQGRVQGMRPDFPTLSGC